MAYIDQANLASDSTFRLRVKVAMMTAAVQIASEAKGTFSDTKWKKRGSLAQHVLTDPNIYLERFAFAVTTNTAIVTGSIDSDIQFQVNSVWDGMAGVSVTD